MNNYTDSAWAVYRSIPFISHALEIDVSGKYLPALDEKIREKRACVFIGLSLVSCGFTTSVSNLIFPYLIGANSPIAFTVTAALLTPTVVAIGILALGILGYKLDEMLTARAATKMAMQEYQNNDSPSDHVFSWLLGDIERIKLLLKSVNVDLNKKNSFNESLIKKAAREAFYKSGMDIFLLLWDRSSNSQKAAIIGWLDGNSLDFLIDNKKILPEMFTELEQCEIQRNLTLRRLQILIDLGFDIDAGGKESKRYEISQKIYEFALDGSEWEKNGIFSMINILKVNTEKKITNTLALGRKDDSSIFKTLPDELLHLIMTKVKAESEDICFENSLKFIEPCLTANQSMLKKACRWGYVNVGRILWDKANDEERKASFKMNLEFNSRAKFARSLLADKKVTLKILSDQEQYDILYQNLILWKTFDDPDSFKEYMKLGFKIDVRNNEGLTLREKIITDQFLSTELIPKACDLLDEIAREQAIDLGVILEPGLNDEGSDLSILPKDILNHIVNTMARSH